MNTIKLNHDQWLLLVDTLQDIMHNNGQLDEDLMECLNTTAFRDLYETCITTS